MMSRRDSLYIQRQKYVESKRMRKDISCNSKQKRTRMDTLISGKLDNITRKRGIIYC